MTSPERSTLARECEVFSRYLLGSEPNAYVTEKYLDAHQRDPNYAGRGSFDHMLARFAARGPQRARLADSYACVLARKSTLRKKLVLLAAILETCSPSQEVFDSVDSSGRVTLVTRLLGSGLLFVLHFLVALACFAPFHFFLELRATPGKERG